MEGAGCKERIGNTPENEIRPDWSKLHPGGSRFQAMALKRHFDGYAVISEAGVASKFGLFRVEVCCCRTTVRGVVVSEAATATKLDKQLAEVWAGPLAGRRLRSNPKKPRDIKAELAPI